MLNVVIEMVRAQSMSGAGHCGVGSKASSRQAQGGRALQHNLLSGRGGFGSVLETVDGVGWHDSRCSRPSSMELHSVQTEIVTQSLIAAWGFRAHINKRLIGTVALNGDVASRAMVGRRRNRRLEVCGACFLALFFVPRGAAHAALAMSGGESSIHAHLLSELGCRLCVLTCVFRLLVESFGDLCVCVQISACVVYWLVVYVCVYVYARLARFFPTGPYSFCSLNMFQHRPPMVTCIC